MIELDVRDMPAPEPMQAALTELFKLEEGEIIHFHHIMVPQMLLPRLNNHFFEIKEDGDDVHLYICHKEDAASIETIKGLVG